MIEGMSPDPQRLAAALNDLAQTIHTARGFYFDARAGFLYARRQIAQAVESYQRKDPNFDPETTPLIYGSGPPEGNSPHHVVSQAEAMRRMADEGFNHVVLGQWFVVVVFGYWESTHRATIASALGLASADALKIPIFGDLRRLRHAVLHERGRISQELTSRLEVLTFVTPSDALDLRVPDINQIAQGIEAAMLQVAMDAGIDPTSTISLQGRSSGPALQNP